MGNQLISYKNELWKVIHDFKCTNSDQPFTLQPGKYLFICKGGASDGRKVDTNLFLMGGLSMAVIDVTDTTTFHAVVGGNSIINDAATLTTIPGPAGFNGGSPGSKSYSSNYRCGLGGGGASDIRLLQYDPSEYPTYDADGTFHEPSESVITVMDANDNNYYVLEYIRNVGSYSINSANYNYSHFVTDYIPSYRTKIVFDGVIFSKDIVFDNYSALFGSRNGNNGDALFEFYTKWASSAGKLCYRSGKKSVQTSDFPFDEHIKLVCFQNKAEWFMNNTSIGSMTISDYVKETSVTGIPLRIFATCYAANADSNYGQDAQLFSFKIYEVDDDNTDILVRDYVPVQRVSDNKIGLFETISKNVIWYNDNGFEAGPKKRNHPSINSRIMVAGGAGGLPSGNFTEWPSQVGGGIIGGGIAGSGITGSGNRYEQNNFQCTNQSSGYMFGYARPSTRISSSNNVSYGPGSGGAGGGWYGGFTQLTNATDNNAHSSSGSGGSGYVLTSTSYKPDGYDPDSKYYMTNVYMGSGQSDSGEVIIAKLVSKCNAGDTIEFYSTANMEHITLPAGTYKLECYGGNVFTWCHNNDEYTPKGGYACGELRSYENKEIVVNVGGRGMQSAGYGKFITNTSDYALKMYPYGGYNGGGSPTSPFYRISHGGGATDMRIDGDTMYHRFIVAGGAGSNGYRSTNQQGYGGNGGGAVGGDGSPSVRYYNNGPGTQTESPSDIQPSVAGSFGQGGSSTVNGNYYPGTGGGGWYGGSGAVYDYPGTGGSGYVLTEDSYKPDGYLVDDKYRLSETSLVQGGNTREDQQPFAKITVIELLTPIIAHDNDGYKYYDQSISRWRLIRPQPSQLTKDMFDAYPDSMFMGDTNLMDEYQLYMCDENEETTSIGLLTTPHHVRISTDTNNSSTINNIYIDSDPYDDTVFSPKVHVIKDQTTQKNRVIFDVYKHQPGDQIFKLYHVELTGSPGQQASYRYFSKSDVTPSTDCLPNNPCYGTLVKPRGEMDEYRDETGHIKTAQYLLPLRINGSYGFRSEYVLDLYDNGTSSITTACSIEFRRKFYTASSCYINGTWYLQIKSFDPSALTDQVHLEWQVTWSTLAGSNTGYAVSGFLMDENKFYFTSSHINDRIFIVNRVSGQVSGRIVPDNGHAYINGRIEWYDDTYTSIVTGDNSAKHDMYLFNIKSNQYTVLSDNSPGVNWWDIAVSDKSILLVDKDSNYCHINIYNKQSKTWTTINQNDYGEEFGCCYGDGKFYVITPTHLVVIEDKTPYTIANSYYVEWGNNNKVIRPTYCNGAVIVPRYNSQWLYVFNLKREMYSMMYLAWNTNAHEASRAKMCSPCAYRSYYFYPGGVSALYLNYMGNDKYNIGYKYAQYQISYNTESESSFEYDDAYVEMTDTCALISDGYQLYEVEEYDENHVTHIDVSKENYQFAYGFKLYKGDE